MNLRKYLIFISGPLTQGNTAENIANAHNAAIELIKAGFPVIVPHDTALWGNYMLDVGENRKAFVTEKDVQGIAYETWMQICFTQVTRSDAVLRLPGYSPGGDREVKLAESKGIHVFHSVEQVVAYFDWLEKTKLGS